MKRGLLVAFAGLLLLIGCSPVEYCPEESYIQAKDTLEGWRDETFWIVAGSNQLKPSELGPVIEELETYGGFIKNYDVPPCLDNAKSLLMEMNKNDLKFLRDRLENGVFSTDEETWLELYTGYLDEIDWLDKCVPNCEP